MPSELEPPAWLDDGAPLPDGPPEYEDFEQRAPRRKRDRPEFDPTADAGYLAMARLVVHPYIVWPEPFRAKKEGDADSKSPNPRFIENTAAMLDAYKISVRWNLMRHGFELRIADFSPASERAENATMEALLSLAVRHGLQRNNVLSHLHGLAREYHPVRDWILSAKWDGLDRLPELWATLELPDHASDEDRGVGYMLLRRWIVSCAAAVAPPIQGKRPFTPQGVLTLQGAQGKGKTEWMKALAPPDSEWIYAGFVLDPHDRDSIQQVTSYWIVELGEVDATFKRSDASALKGFITKDKDVYRRPYAHGEERVPRVTVLGATVNRREFLVDETGNRRWWTIPISGITWQHDINIQQLWAQAYALALAGEPYWLSADEQQWLAGTNRQFEMRDPLVDDLWETWRVVSVSSVAHPPRATLSEIWSALPGRENKIRSRGETATILQALRDAGTENSTVTHGVSTFRVEKLATQSWRGQSRWNGGE